MTLFYTKHSISQAESYISGNASITNANNSLVNNENSSKNNFNNLCCQDALKCVSLETLMKKGRHERPFNLSSFPKVNYD